MNQNGRPLEKEDNLTLLINKMMQYSIEPRIRKYVKGYTFLSFARNYKKIIGYRTTCCESGFQNVVHKPN